MGIGFVLSSATVYVVEIASNDMRGILGCMIQFLGTIGILYTFSLGAVLNWYWLALSNFVFVPPVVIGMTFVPESPRWLILKGRQTDALESLRWLRGRNVEESIAREMGQIKLDLEKERQTKASLRDLLACWKPFLNSLLLMFLMQFCGMGVLLYYTGVIFEQARSTIDSRISFILVGVALVFSCVCSVIIVPRFSRRALMLGSLFGMSVLTTVLGTSLYFIEQTPRDQELGPGLGWLPLATVLVFLVVGNAGFGTLIWVISAELLPPKVRTLGNSIAICFSFLMGFVVCKTFVNMVALINNSGAFWLYAGINLVGGIILYFTLPETGDKST